MKADYVDQEAETTKRAWLHPIMTSTSLAAFKRRKTLLFDWNITCRADSRTTEWTRNTKHTLEKKCDQILKPREQTGSEPVTGKSSETSHFSNLTKQYNVVPNTFAKIL